MFRSFSLSVVAVLLLAACLPCEGRVPGGWASQNKARVTAQDGTAYLLKVRAHPKTR